MPAIKLFFLVFVASVTSQSCEFGIGNANETAANSLGWTRLDIDDLENFKSQFIEEYNSNGGINKITDIPYQNGVYDACWICINNLNALSTDNLLVTAKNPNFTSSCSSSLNKYKFYLSWSYNVNSSLSLISKQRGLHTLNDSFTFKIVAMDCQFGNGDDYPVLYYRGNCSPEPTAAPTLAPIYNTCFGTYSTDETIPLSDGWTRIDIPMLETLKSHFVEEYNTNNGIDRIDSYTVEDRCHICLNDTGVLTIDDHLVLPEESWDGTYINDCGVLTDKGRFILYPYPLKEGKEAYIASTLDEDITFGIYDGEGSSYYNCTGRSASALYYKDSCSPPSTSSPSMDSLAPTLVPTSSSRRGNSSDDVTITIPENYVIPVIIIFVCLCVLCVFSCICAFKRKKRKNQITVERQLSRLQN